MNLYVVDDDTIAIIIDPIRRNIENSRDTRRLISFRMSFSTMGKVDGEERSTVILKRVGPMETKVDFITELEFGMPMGRAIVRKELEQHLYGYKACSSYYLNLLSGDRLGEINEKDGVTLAELLYEGGRANVKETISNCVILSSLQVEFPWFEVMMEEVLRNKLRPASNSIATNADCLSTREARRIGGSLAISLATNVTAAGGVDEWILQYRALQELDEKYCWIRPMMNAIAPNLVKDGGWGLKFRVCGGAALSTVDWLSDIYITYTFWRDKKYMFYNASLGMLFSSLFLMLLFVFEQNKRRGWRYVAMEMAPVLFGLKPAVDAYRVAIDAKMEEGQMMDPLQEMIYVKTTEMFAEAIPGVIIQLSAILSGGKLSTGAVVSLATSAMTTGFVSSQISFDFDTDQVMRKGNPDFYGYIPDNAKKRAVVFISMTFMSALNVLVKGMSTTLIGMLGAKWAIAYIAADLGLYLAIKVLRGDFWYWIQIDSWISSVLLGLVTRIVVKIVADFTNLGECTFAWSERMSF